MKIAVNAFSARRGGGQTYLMNLLQHLDGFGDIFVYLFSPPSLKIPSHPQIKSVHVNWPTDNPLLRTLWEKFFFKNLLTKINADILFCPGGLINTTPPQNCKTVTMFRNMMPFDRIQRSKYPYGLMRTRNWLLEKALLKSMYSAELVIFMSDYAKDLIEKLAGKQLNNAITIPHGLSDRFKTFARTPQPSRPKWLPKEDYFLYVSIFDVYKNQLEVVHGYHLAKEKGYIDQEKLVLAGYNTSAYGKLVRKEIIKLGLEDFVILPGNIPYEDLPKVYHHAKINIFASLCENCPNILLEALGSGRPILASKLSPMTEFGKDAVVYFDPVSPENFAQKMLLLNNNPAYMKELSEKAGKRSCDFDWQKTAKLTWNAMLNLHS